jgi:hypothetical protein
MPTDRWPLDHSAAAAPHHTFIFRQIRFVWDLLKIAHGPQAGAGQLHAAWDVGRADARTPGAGGRLGTGKIG